MPRPRKPTALKELAGTLQPCRTNEREPRLQPGVPLPPPHASAMARKVWPGIAGMLEEMGVLTAADAPALEALCETYADLLRARQALDRGISDGEDLIAAAGDLTYVTEGKNGKMLRARPEVAMVADADRRLCMWLARFGLTPADRSRVSAAASGEQEEDEYEGF